MQISLTMTKSWRKTALLLVVGFIAALWAAVVWNHQRSENVRINDSNQETAFLALLYAKHAAAKFGEIDHALQDLRKTWVARPLDMKADTKEWGDSLGTAVLQMAIINADGFLAYSTLGMGDKPVNLTDREHFKVHLENPTDKLFVSRPVKGRRSEKWSIQMTRPIFNKEKFAGVIVLSVDPQYFADFYQEGDLQKGGSATIVRDTGERMVMNREFEQYIGTSLDVSRYAAPGAPLRGSFRAFSQLNGLEYLYSYVRLPAYGLTVVIGYNLAETLAPVRSDHLRTLIAASFVTLLMLLLALQFLRALKNQEAAQKALLQSQRRLQARDTLLEELSENIPGCIYQYQWFPDGRTSYPFVSKGVEAVLNLTQTEVYDKPGLVFARVHPDDREAMAASMAESARTLQPWKLEFRVKQEQELRWVAGLSQPKKLDDGTIVWNGFATDVTASKKTNVALQRANEELQTFSYSVSHDLRSPLSTIGGFSALLGKKLKGDDNEKARHYLSRIQLAVSQMDRLIVDLLKLAQVSRSTLKLELVDLSALASQVANNMQTRQPERQVALHIEGGLKVRGDLGLLRAVLENLLGNAWKYSAKQAQAEIHVGQLADAARNQVFFVRDNGVGFDMAYSGKLFQPFERLHTPAEFAGNGVGLATVNRIIGRHGGNIWAESAPGQGATFFFTLS
jgi:signal transduction histidine kinase